MPTEKPTVVEALSKVMDAVQAVGKKQRNLEQNYVFRGVDAVVNAVGPELRKAGVIVVPMLDSASYRDVTTSRGKPSRECTVRVTYRFYGPAGDFIDATVPGESMDFGDKGAAKAMSVAYRIVLLQALCIPTDEPEPDAATYERAHRDEWDSAAQAPAPAQVAAFDALSKEIARANKDQIQEIAKRANAALKAGDITKFQNETLAKLGAARLAQLQPAGPEGGNP